MLGINQAGTRYGESQNQISPEPFRSVITEVNMTPSSIANPGYKYPSPILLTRLQHLPRLKFDFHSSCHKGIDIIFYPFIVHYYKTMSLRTHPNRCEASSNKSSDKPGQHDRDDLTTVLESSTSFHPWQPEITRFHLVAVLFGALLYELRASEISIFGHRIGLLWGNVPIECMVWSFTILELVVRDITHQLRGLLAE